MSGIFWILYLILFLIAVCTALFIIFHLVRYALDRRMATFMTLLFTIVTTILLISNAALFSSLSLDTLLP